MHHIFTGFCSFPVVGEYPEVPSWLNSRDFSPTWDKQILIIFTKSIEERSHEYLSRL